jgi:two-component system, LuxR family, response regulator TtrR
MSLRQQRTANELGPSRIVVVDDDPAVRGALSRLLRITGYDVQTFPSAEDFLGGCNPADVDCLIVDVYLTGMSGIDLHSQLGARGDAPPTVFVTAHDEAPALRMCLRSHGVMCLRKPFEDHSLMAAIDRVVEEVRQ